MKFRYKYFIFILVPFLWIGVRDVAIAQTNLVPNYSFETDSVCPNNASEINYVPPWYSPTWGSPDYFNICDGSGLTTVGLPLNYFGYQYAKTGAAYAGIFCYFILSNSPTVEAKEYLQVKLTDSLIENRKYCVSFYVNLATSLEEGYHNLAITEMGLYISNNSFLVTNELTLPYPPQIKSPTGVFLNDTLNWTEVSGTYTAQGGEKYITIGNFNNPTDTLNMPNNNNNITCVSYYYIDDVSVVDCTDMGVGELGITNEELGIYPNPANESLTLTLSKVEGIKTVRVYNVLGEVVFTSSFNNLQTTIDISTYASGVYFLSVKEEDKIINKKFIKE